MEYQLNHHHHHHHRGGAANGGGSSIHNSSSDLNNNSSSSSPISTHHTTTNTNNNTDPMQSWWESVSKARTRIQSLLTLLPSHYYSSLSSLADSDNPARSLLDSPNAYSALSSSLSSPLSGSGDDPLCHWLYDSFLSSLPDLRLVVLSFLPLLSGLYLSRLHSPSSPSQTTSPSSPSLSGFEAVLLALYSSVTKSRSGQPLLISIPDLSQPSLYHNASGYASVGTGTNSVGVLSPPLEPQLAVKSTKRGCIIGVAVDLYYKHISQMPNWSKIELCRFAASWAGPHCACARSLDPVSDFDDGLVLCGEEMGRLGLEEEAGVRVPLPWEMLQPVLRVLGHCLLAPGVELEIREEAGVAVRRLYARASHDLFPQGILATRSLIRLDNRARAAAEAVAVTNSSSSVNTPSKSKKPEVLLVSK